MEQRFEWATKRVEENNLVDLLFYKKYSNDESLQKAYLDGYAIGVLSSILFTASYSDECAEKDTELLQKALNGDKTAIRTLENLINNRQK